jgi:hypothetical protein
MRFSWVVGLVLWGMAAAVPAAVLQDWSNLDPSKEAGVFADSKGSKVDLAVVEGPAAGQKAIQINSKLVEWGGIWTVLEKNMSKVKALRFKAKNSVPGYLTVGLSDDRKVQYIAMVKVVSADWTEFVLPLSYFKKTPWPMPDAPKDVALNFAKIKALTLQPQATGAATLSVGPISGESGKVKAVTGYPGPDAKVILVQDFSTLEKNAYGPFADEKTGTKISLALEKAGDDKAGFTAKFKYTMKPGGWCGYWMRAGDMWGGQDWTGAKKVTCKIYSQEPLFIEFGFNDANQNSYVAHFPWTKGKGWETISIPFEKFDLNEYYQPPEAKKDAPLDLSHIETFNIAPQTKGDHEFEMGELTIEK